MERLDRRIVFFLIAAAAAFLLRFALLSTEKPVVRNVPTIVGIVYLILALLFQLEWMSNRKSGKDDERARGARKDAGQ
jgi:hypothetical protein